MRLSLHITLPFLKGSPNDFGVKTVLVAQRPAKHLLESLVEESCTTGTSCSCCRLGDF